MNPAALAQLALATCIFIAAANVAKTWAIEPSLGKAVVALALYTGGNLLMLRLIRSVGMATAFSLSSVLQLVAVNAVAIMVYGERLSAIQGLGVGLAVLSVALITLG